ncbi:MAG TPA: DPP IV N-terminal domain-containing protein, partial [Gemmatimonadaceae bacterium]|nr:DPP IV N-terminal domain-containing protein [Gemmatimonadaceae bacterium]
MQITRRFAWITFTAFVAVQASLFCAAMLRAQTAAPRAPSAGADSVLTLERIFNSGEFAARHVSSIRWTADGKGYTELERATGAHGGRDLVRYDVVTGKREVVVSAERLVMPGGDTLIEIEGYQWSADGKRLLIFTNAQRVWREDTRGDYWVIDVASGPPRKLGGSAAAPSTLMFAKFSPDGGRIAYVRANNLYVEDATTGAITPLTTDGSHTIINGTFDWVYEEELNLRDGFRWSPDGKRIAYWQLDDSGVGNFLLIDDTDSLYSYT